MLQSIKMNDNSKTKRELIKELAAMRERICRMEATEATCQQAENALRESEKKYRKIIEQMEDGYFEVDLAGNLTFFNDAECKILGYSRDELMGMNNRQYQDAANARRAYQLFKEVYETGNPVKASDFRIIRKNGTKAFHEITISLIRDVKGKPTGFRGLSRDVTERRQAEEEKGNLEERLNRAEKMEAVGQLAGGIAHVLNNILGILNGYAELLLTEIPEGQKARGHVEKILQSTERGTLIIQDLLTLSGGGVMVSGAVNLNTVVSDLIETPVFEKLKNFHPRVIFKTDCWRNLPNIKGSRGHLEKMLTNLVSNAAEAIPGDGTVTIRTEHRPFDQKRIGHQHEGRDGDDVILSVSDTGTGISDEHREKIFEPFYTKKTMGSNGTGLGLSIVWGTVKDHNGYIDVQTKVGEGTVFTLCFPASYQT
jgi:PAS domain S-box-containing protein